MSGKLIDPLARPEDTDAHAWEQVKDVLSFIGIGVGVIAVVGLLVWGIVIAL